MTVTETLSLTELRQQDDRTTTRIITVLREDPSFHALSVMEGQALMDRDALDNEKLRKGIRYAVENGVLAPKETTSAPQRIQIIGKSADDVCDVILRAVHIHGDTSKGRIISLQGLSGTGKGTTGKKIVQRLPRTTTWSNGNIFRCLTFCLLRDAVGLAAHEAIEKLSDATLPASAITPAAIALCMKQLKFDFFIDSEEKAHYDLQILPTHPGAKSLLVSEVHNTILKYPSISRFVPLVAEKSQGEVIQFTLAAMREITVDAGWNVLIEGRNETLNYIDTPHRFELVLGAEDEPLESTLLLLGQRRAAQRVAGEVMRASRGVTQAAVEKKEIVQVVNDLLA